MGGLFTKKKPPQPEEISRVTEHDRAILVSIEDEDKARKGTSF